ncbi:pyridoxamine 5'-phosphate oxidase family protein [Crossiella cryophila]|uniref:Pyridoxamine 5'-phosphate oxidase N-terminal domain-containing protein n=1 Tax=Crossiella cryophila TaxID=43355 RepID=A0A7W7FX71_9PSEU|nr:pyridoxamine 5'-phosphate oxidase family protein [Crossiella cryophila]MBB4680810.1 hypothetical protein [Crossiella cryophila]
MRWQEFEQAAPRIAALARERFTQEQLVLLGTVRRDGSPRISAVECDFTAADFCVGMMTPSTKASDLLRDPRVTAHSLPPGKENPLGDVKIFGRAVEVLDRREKDVYEDAIFARLDWRPPEPYHCFAFDITSAGFVRFEDGGRRWLAWREGEAEREEFLADGPC